MRGVLLIATAFLISRAASAGLGGDATTIQTDAKKLGIVASEVRVSQRSTYARHEISSNWLLLHEFVGGNGKVFALAWQGKRHPDLSSLLAEHLSDFQKAVSAGRKQHQHGGAMTIESGNLHVELGGHMGMTYGHVWLTDQIPYGTDLNEIQ